MNKQPKNQYHKSRSSNSSNSSSLIKPERIQKVLSQSGLGSRRYIEELIEAGRIKVNSNIAKLGDKAGLKDRISLDGKIIQLKLRKKTKIIITHKPAGFLCSSVNENGKTSVFELFKLPKNERWIMVGRLDFNTSGLLLFTNNGNLANELMHPSNQIKRVYAVRVYPRANDEQITQLLDGIELEDGFAQFSSVDEINNQSDESLNFWYEVSLYEGRFREVRRLWEAVGLNVSRLIRTEFGPFFLPRELSRGKWRFLEDNEVKSFLTALKPKAPKTNLESKNKDLKV